MAQTPRAERLYLRNHLKSYIMYLQLNRHFDSGTQTSGTLKLRDYNGNVLLSFDTLELSYNNNEKRISCIPCGVYVVKKKFSFVHGNCFELKNVPYRQAILIHKGNFNSDTKGCILIGNGVKDINFDEHPDILNSKVAMSNLLRTLKTTTIIHISNDFE